VHAASTNVTSTLKTREAIGLKPFLRKGEPRRELLRTLGTLDDACPPRTDRHWVPAHFSMGSTPRNHLVRSVPPPGPLHPPTWLTPSPHVADPIPPTWSTPSLGGVHPIGG